MVKIADPAERNPGILGKLLLLGHQGVSPLSNQTTSRAGRKQHLVRDHRSLSVERALIEV
jgi:hypothetical protein